MTTTDPVLQHREDYWTFVEESSEEPARSVLLKLRDHWHHVNDTYFDSIMKLPYITITDPGGKRSRYAACFPVSSWGSRLEIKIRESLLTRTHPDLDSRHKEGCQRFVEDVIMHETVHQFTMEISKKFEDLYSGHGPHFAGICNRIGADLGLPPVVAKNRNGSDLPRAAQWPHNVRPAEYYGGAYPVERERKPHPCPTCTCRVEAD